jgi:hypothetical protein
VSVVRISCRCVASASAGFVLCHGEAAVVPVPVVAVAAPTTALTPASTVVTVAASAPATPVSVAVLVAAIPSPAAANTGASLWCEAIKEATALHGVVGDSLNA